MHWALKKYVSKFACAKNQLNIARSCLLLKNQVQLGSRTWIQRRGIPSPKIIKRSTIQLRATKIGEM